MTHFEIKLVDKTRFKKAYDEAVQCWAKEYCAYFKEKSSSENSSKWNIKELKSLHVISTCSSVVWVL